MTSIPYMIASCSISHSPSGPVPVASVPKLVSPLIYVSPSTTQTSPTAAHLQDGVESRKHRGPDQSDPQRLNVTSQLKYWCVGQAESHQATGNEDSSHLVQLVSLAGLSWQTGPKDSHPDGEMEAQA